MTQPTETRTKTSTGLELHRFRPSGRTAAEDQRSARFVAAVERGFYEKVPDEDALSQTLGLHVEDGRTYVGLYEAGTGSADPALQRPVSTLASFPKKLYTGRGRDLESLLISDVTVLPTHRRRGILRTMMEDELARAAADGMPMAALTASEATIYGRFGFGVATTRRAVEVDAGPGTALASAVSVSMVMVEPKDLTELGPRLFERTRRQTPGSVERTAAYRIRETDTRASENERRGSGLYAAVHHDDEGQPRGYVTYRFAGWDRRPATVKVDLLYATTAESYRAIWAYLINLDLIEKIEWELAPDDRLLEHLFTDHRRVTTTSQEDHLWLRILDVPACFRGRAYGMAGELGKTGEWGKAGELTLEVSDALGYAAGTWRLAVRGGEADVVACDGPADLSLDVAELSSVYLGGISAEMLRQAGGITEHRAGAAAELTAMLAPDRPVYCLTGF
ncbi:GNAT family N-acetyltransferase [Citricoccus sp. GCM10030269]|uniref:GNAT family N-acetyltransferase n=1 Tax=Citricoccus sp. GCM10030269 TaxID=3273388 RepID=UPI00360F60CF